ncbi:M3 family metallopeptidase [Escherichia coli]
MHGLFARQLTATFSGTNTPRDFVEFPSQINEHGTHPAGIRSLRPALSERRAMLMNCNRKCECQPVQQRV